MIKLSTCKYCQHVFASSKTQAFCSGRCRHSYSLINPKSNAYRDGASNANSDTSNTN